MGFSPLRGRFGLLATPFSLSYREYPMPFYSLISSLFLLLLACFTLCHCAKVKVEPIEVKPIEINVNVRITVQKELHDFFGDIDAKAKSLTN